MRKGTLILVLLILGSGVLGAQTLRISANEALRPFGELIKTVLSDGGFDPVIDFFPSERSLQNVNSGLYQGEFARGELAVALNSHLLKIDVPLTQLAVSAYFLRPGLNITTEADLKNLSVGIQTGGRLLETRYGALARLSEVSEIRQLGQMLQAGRLDVMVMEDVLFAALPPGLRVSVKKSPTLMTYNAYFVVNSSQAALVPRLTALFRRWVDSGRWQKGIAQVDAEFQGK